MKADKQTLAVPKQAGQSTVTVGGYKKVHTAPLGLNTLSQSENADENANQNSNKNNPNVQQVSVVINEPEDDRSGQQLQRPDVKSRLLRSELSSSQQDNVASSSGGKRPLGPTVSLLHERCESLGTPRSQLGRLRLERPSVDLSNAATITGASSSHRASPLKAFLEAAHHTLTGRASLPAGLAPWNASSSMTPTPTSSVPRDYHAILFALVKDGKIRGVTAVLNNNILNLNYRDATSSTYLHYAASNGHSEIIRLLCEHHASVDAPDDEMRSPLIRATLSGNFECVRALLDCSATVDKHDILGWTALMWASYRGNVEIARLLIERGANVNVKADKHMTCLSWAAGRGHHEIVRLLLAHGANPNSTDRYGSTALIWAARNAHADCCELLLDAGANADFVGMHARTPLIVAATAGSADCVRVLLRKATNLNVVDKDGYTALGRAVKAQAFEIIEQLVAAGAQTDAQDHEGESILIQAVKTATVHLVRLLLPKCNNVNYQDSEGKTALFHAVDRNQLEIVAALLETKANVELAANASENNDTPILRAVRNRSVEITELLIKKAKAKITVTDSKGNTCLHLALRNRNRRLTELLLRNPKDNYLLYKPNRAGETPYGIDMAQASSVLTQIFGFRNLNTIDASDLLGGYDLYSSIIADVLTEPGLVTPLTVGLYAKWGSGKSFLLERLEHEMRKFTYSAQLIAQLREVDAHDIRFRPTYVTYCFAFALFVAYLVGVSTFSVIWCAVTFVSAFFVPFFVLATLVLCARRGLMSALRFCIHLNRFTEASSVLIKSLFCIPHQSIDNDPHAHPQAPSAVRFFFSEKTPLNAVYSNGEQIAAHLLISLFKNVERELGTFTTRLNCGLQTRMPPEGHTHHGQRYKAFCYIPYWLCFTIVLIAMLVNIVLVVAILRQSYFFSSNQRNDTNQDLGSVGADPENAAMSRESMEITVIVLSSFLGLLLVTYSLCLLRVLVAFVYPSQRRIQRALDILSNTGESSSPRADFHALSFNDHLVSTQLTYADSGTRLLFLKTMQQEIQRLSRFVHLHDTFSQQTSRFVLIVDGLDSVETAKLLSAIDLISALFCDSSSRFVVLLAIDPQLIIAGVDRSITGTRDVALASSGIAGHTRGICGYDYLRNLVQLPIYLQSPNLKLLPKTAPLNRTRSQYGSKRELGSFSASGRQLSMTSVRHPAASSDDLSSIFTSSQHLSHAAPNNARPARAASELNVTLMRNDYFSDINPKSMRRLLNITAVIGRILRAYSIEVSWPKLAVWTNITEQWPFRSAAIVWYFEQNIDSLEDSLTLRKVYERMTASLPAALNDARLKHFVEVDRDPEKLERLLSNEQLTRITVYDLRRFVPFGINLDPFIRKVIRENANGLNGRTAISGQLRNSVPQAIATASTTYVTPLSQSVPIDIPSAFVRSADRRQLDVASGNSQLRPILAKQLSHWNAAELSTVVCAVGKPAFSSEQLTEKLMANEIDGALVALMTELNDLNHLLQLPFVKWQRVKAALAAARERDESRFRADFFVDSVENQLCDASLSLSHAASVPRQTSPSPPKDLHTRTVSFRGLEQVNEASETGSKPQLELLDDNLHELLIIQETLGSRIVADDETDDTSEYAREGRQLDALNETSEREGRHVGVSMSSPNDSDEESDRQPFVGAASSRNKQLKTRERSKSGQGPEHQAVSFSVVPKKKSSASGSGRSHNSSINDSASVDTRPDRSVSESAALLSGSSGEKVGKFLVTKVEVPNKNNSK